MNNKVVKNASWIIACRIVQSLLGFFISMLVARYLGPSNYGLINYAASIVAFLLPVAKLGLSSILVREVINYPDQEGETLGTALTLSIGSSLLSVFGVIAFTLIANRDEPTTILVCALYSIQLIFQALEMIQYWYQAKLLSKYTSLTALVAYIVFSAYKIYLLITGKNIFWFAVSQSIDYFVIASVLLFIYHKIGGQRLSFSKQAAKRMLADSKYYIIADLMIAVFGQTDRILLKLMISNAETGVYSAAVTCTTFTSFVFVAILDSARPSIFESRKYSMEAFEKNVVRLYSVIIYLALLQSVAMALFSPIIISILYGAEYVGAVNVLRVIVWYTIFSYIGSARNIWLLAEGKQKIIWKLNLFGAIFNVVSIVTLIPLFGAIGAAFASLCTQIFTNVILGFIFKPLRRNNTLMLESLNPKYIGEMLSLIKNRKA